MNDQQAYAILQKLRGKWRDPEEIHAADEYVTLFCQAMEYIEHQPERNVRYCPNCSRIGEVPKDTLNCCPDADPTYIPKEIAIQAKYGFRQRIEQQCTLSEPMITAIIEQAIVNNTVYATAHHEGHGFQNEGRKVDYRIGPMFCHVKVAGDTIRQMKKAGVKFV